MLDLHISRAADAMEYFFDQLRTQAIASLHSGLQNNQGIPVAQVVKWLGMEVSAAVIDIMLCSSLEEQDPIYHLSGFRVSATREKI